MFRQIGIVIVLAGFGVVACGDDSSSVPLATPGPTIGPETTDPDTPTTPPVATTDPTGTEPPNEGGFGQPAQFPGEFPPTGGYDMMGVVRLFDNGCFMLDFNGVQRPDAFAEQRVVAFPEGYITDPTDPTTVVAPDGWRIADGTAIDATGQIMGVDMIPGGGDSRWGSQLGYCDPGGLDMAVLDTAAPAFDPAALTTDQMVGLLTDAEFTESWPCGYGLATSTADQHVGLVIYALAEPSEAGTVTLPDAGWSASVNIGTHMFAQNCDDAIEFWEPEQIITESWTLTAGEFGLEIADGPAGWCGSPPLATVLTGAVIDTPSGPISLPDLELARTRHGAVSPADGADISAVDISEAANLGVPAGVAVGDAGHPLEVCQVVVHQAWRGSHQPTVGDHRLAGDEP